MGENLSEMLTAIFLITAFAGLFWLAWRVVTTTQTNPDMEDDLTPKEALEARALDIIGEPPGSWDESPARRRQWLERKAKKVAAIKDPDLRRACEGWLKYLGAEIEDDAAFRKRAFPGRTTPEGKQS